MNKIASFFHQNNNPYKMCQAFTLRWDYIKTKYWYSLFMKACGKRNLIMHPLYLTPESIILHNNVLIWRNARIEGVKNYLDQTFEPVIILHNNVSIQQNIHLTCATCVEIGKYTAIASNVTITDIHHPYTDIDTPIELQPIETKSVFIGESCKLYNNCVILPGTTIGKHCTIGANSVVSGNFPDYSVIVGSPAKIVKRYSMDKQAWFKTDANGNFLEK